MALITANDMKIYYDYRDLVQLTNDGGYSIDPDDVSNINATNLSAAIDYASTTVENYLRYIYDLTSPTSEIKAITADLTWCRLWQRRGREPATVTELRVEAKDRLAKMSDTFAKEQRDGKQVPKIGPRM